MKSSFWMVVTSSLLKFNDIVSAPVRKLEAMCTEVFISPLGKAVLMKQVDGGMESRRGKKLISVAVFFQSAPLSLFVNISQLYLVVDLI
ncbi:hypothetical protein [Nostoc sp.]|uniref:hypothetical protein n=1 Tax=Nostoc sp. TaxID=1180 RepID=UPI002FF4D40D